MQKEADDKLVEKCDKDIDENEMVCNDTLYNLD